MPKILFIILTTLLLSCNTKSDKKSDNHSAQTDSLKYWTYKIDYDFEKPNDSIKPIGKIEFWRTKSIDDKISQELYGKPWTPSIDFEIYNISDLKYCEKISNKTKLLSSCVDKNVGGDLIIVQNYIFINNSVCVNCIRYDNGIDYCRPILNKIMADLYLTENSTLNKVDKEIGMKIKQAE